MKGQNYGDIPLRMSALCQMKLWHVNKCNLSSVVYFLFNIVQISEVKMIPELFCAGVFVFDQWNNLNKNKILFRILEGSLTLNCFQIHHVGTPQKMSAKNN